MNIDVFISHHTDSSLHIVEGIVNKLEANGIKCWYAPRDTSGDYAGSIADAIEACRVFLLVLNKAASESPHVLNELNLVTERLSSGSEVDIIPFHTADTDISKKARYYIGRMHWLDAITPSIYDRIDELAEKIAVSLDKKIDLSVQVKKTHTEHKIISKIPQVRDVFYGRDTLIESIEKCFYQGNRVLFLEGIGGIGKSEIAKQYALKHASEYENIIFATYNNSLKKLVCDPTVIEITNLEQGTESEDEFFKHKMQVLRSICDEKTLIIVDNFDVDEDEDLSMFIEGSHKVIFTTRNSHSGYPTAKVGPILDEDILFKIFEKNYGEPASDEDIDWLKKIFKLVENHTYMIELIAKQMDASFLSAEEMYLLIKKGKLQSDVTESVQGRKEQRTAFEHLSLLFNTSNLSDEEKTVMEILALMGTKGIPAKRFKEWSGVPDMNITSKLIHKSWVRKETGQRLSLHPLMAEVIKANLKPDFNSLKTCLKNVANFAFHAWHRVYGENLEVADNIYSVLSYFLPFDAKAVKYFEPMISFLWQVGRFDDSIYFDTKLYRSCLEFYGENSMATGFVAKSLGGCYFNSRRETESIPWYKQGLKSMLLSDEDESEDLAMSYEKVARCYTWDDSQDLKKAEELFNKALEIRNRLKKALQNGETKHMFLENENYDFKKVELCLSGTYMEMGRMYQAAGNYETAMKYTEKSKIFWEKENNQSSSYAYRLYDIGVSLYYLGLQIKANNLSDAKQKFLRAEENLKAALKINLKMRGEIANDTIDNQEYLGDVYAAMEQYGDASNAYMAVISMLENLYVSDCERIQKVKKKMMFELN